MKKIIFLTFTLLFVTCAFKPAFANNIVVDNVLLVDQNADDDEYDIQFDISWNNSWRIAGAPSATANWDAAWVFAKYSVYSGGSYSDWVHCTLLNTSDAPAGSRIDFGATEGVYKGAFVYRSSAGTGSVSWENAEIRWDYGADGVADDALVEVMLFAIEMVYIPRCAFAVGDTDNDRTNCFYEGGTANELQITSEAAITVADTAGNIYYDVDGLGAGDQAGPIPAAFPKGFNDFYIMKYEISQEQYADFLNMLTAVQAANRYPNRNGANRHTISGTHPNYSASAPDRACNFLIWSHFAAYIDWAGLRPFTELEFEKAARGGQAAVDDEYAWGNTNLYNTQYVIDNDGEANATIQNQPAATGNASWQLTDRGVINGPLRCGILAQSATSRQESGAGYYGAMELTGNVRERIVTVGNATGRGFNGTHGDGTLTTVAGSEGNATNTDWPGIDAVPANGVTGLTGCGSRGGGFGDSPPHLSTADRSTGVWNAFQDIINSRETGGRAARTAP